MANPSELERLESQSADAPHFFPVDLIPICKAAAERQSRWPGIAVGILTERRLRWEIQSLHNTPEENRKANAGKGILNPAPPSCSGCVYFHPDPKPNPDTHGWCVHPADNGLYAAIWYGRNPPPAGCPLRAAEPSIDCGGAYREARIER
jgi:hypothetical protein